LSAYLNRDYATALEAWQPLAKRETESSAAQLFLGFMYAKGLGLAQDPAIMAVIAKTKTWAQLLDNTTPLPAKSRPPEHCAKASALPMKPDIGPTHLTHENRT
jgi:TPR repeat protein